eukprot:m.127372 g.127372  ORF g.127372 m.127372 type:complete len:772 (+) comp15656_c1_seq1:43-2358(+)
MASLLPLGSLLILAAFTCAQSTPFRPPAIPLITTDPFMQTWVRADNSTGDSVRYWDGSKKEIVALVRIDGQPFQILGSCLPNTTGPVDAYPNHDDDPGICDIVNYANMGADACNIQCYGTPACQAYVIRHEGDGSTTCFLKSCANAQVPTASHDAYVLTGQHPPAGCPGVIQRSLTVLPTQTQFQLEVNNALAVNLTFLSTMFTEDYVRLSRPVSYVDVSFAALDGKSHNVQVYLDLSAEHTVNTLDEDVEWMSWSDDRLQGTRIGTSSQNVLGFAGDGVNLDWGYLYLSSINDGASAVSYRAGSAAQQRQSFSSSGALPSNPDTRQPRAAGDDLPSVAAVASFTSTSRGSHVFLVAYDEIDAVYYFGSRYKGFWTQTYTNITAAMNAAATEYAAMVTKSVAHDTALLANLTSVGGEMYATIAALAYRQTLAATKLVWNHDRNTMWNFLKEISTNGDMQTMDVVYPASPMMLYTNPQLLKLLLVPVLTYANNETWHTFSDPYSPHQLGTYPLANATTQQQEPMPMENTGNMFLMLLGIVQRDPAHDVSFFYPHFWPLLTSWAEYLQSTLPFPGLQLCTDDFEGQLANNTNLAAKGIVALAAFGELCRLAKADNCDSYTTAAQGFAQMFEKYAFETTPSPPHYRLAYGMPGTWSIKYNLVWQQLLHLDGPFNWTAVQDYEINYYLTQINTYGPPMDERHTYVKLDWLSWAAAMADEDANFHAFMDPIYKFATNSPSRLPLTDLYDTITGIATYTSGFIARPVVGGVFAKMLR